MSDTIQLSPGDEAPAFVAHDQNGESHDLKQYLDDGKTVILYFYPKDSTPGCTTQACDFRDNMARLNGEDHVVLGVSKDSGKSHQRFVEKQELNFRCSSTRTWLFTKPLGHGDSRRTTAVNTWVAPAPPSS